MVPLKLTSFAYDLAATEFGFWPVLPEHYTTRAVLEAYITYAVGKGIPATTIWQSIGKAPDAIFTDNTQDTSFVSAELLGVALHTIHELLQDDYIGFRHALDVQANTYDILGYLAVNCDSMAQTMPLVIEYERILGNLGYTQLLPHPPGMLVSWQCVLTDPFVRRQMLESVLTSWFLYACNLVKFDELAVAVWFEHDAPKDPGVLAEYESVFRCPVLFSQEHSGILVSDEQWTKAFPQANPALRSTLESHAKVNLEKLQLQQRPLAIDERVCRKLRHRFKATLPANKSLVAKDLGMSERSLHRHLKATGNSYRDLEAKVKAELAIVMLQSGQHSSEDIAQRLGFAEIRSFYRAFKAWTGCTIGQYTQQMKNR